MATIGNHMKFNVPKSHRDRVRTFFLDVLQSQPMPAPMPDLDLFVLDDGFVWGVFYCEDNEVLSEAEHLKGAWLEIKTKDVESVRRRLVEFGVKQVNYIDKTRFYFHAPGGQVFRLAPEDGGL